MHNAIQICRIKADLGGKVVSGSITTARERTEQFKVSCDRRHLFLSWPVLDLTLSPDSFFCL